MKIEEAKGEIYNASLCSTSPEGKDPIMEISITVNFKAENYPEIVGMSSEEMTRLFKEGETQDHTLGRGSAIRKGTFNISLGEAFNFPGCKFESAKISMVKNIGAVIKLHTILPSSAGFLTWLHSNFRKMINITITEINEQMSINDIPKEGEAKTKGKKKGKDDNPPF